MFCTKISFVVASHFFHFFVIYLETSLWFFEEVQDDKSSSGATTLHLISWYQDLLYFTGLNIFVDDPLDTFRSIEL